MRIVIIGNGVVALATQIALSDLGIDTVLVDGSEVLNSVSDGLILLSNGLESLREIGFQSELEELGQTIDEFVLKSNYGKLIGSTQLRDAMGFQKSQLEQVLKAHIPGAHLQNKNQFSHFELDPKGRAQSISFKNGDQLKGDLFIVTEGVHTNPRTLGRTHEWIGQVQNFDLVQRVGAKFTKLQDSLGRVAFGFFPTSKDTLKWFLQFDRQKVTSLPVIPEEVKNLTQSLLKNWADPVSSILEMTDFSRAQMLDWMDSPGFPQQDSENIIYLGNSNFDFLPLGNPGINSALQDMIVLSVQLRHVTAGRIELNQALKNYGDLRRLMNAPLYYEPNSPSLYQ